MARSKKTAAQLRRLMKRAHTRGEVYVPPEQTKEDGGLEGKPNANEDVQETATEHHHTEKKPEESSSEKKDEKAKIVVAVMLKKKLADIEKSETLKAKERRSAKRKAEAIAAESTGFASGKGLLEWYEKYHAHDGQHKDQESGRTNPYIAFVGQLAYETTKDDLFQHIQQELGDEHTVSAETVQVRLLTDSKTGKSRGMAFVEVENPEMLYACLKMHHTLLKGRRINVERSAGGGRHSESRKSKLQQFRKDQEQLIDDTVKNMFEEYKAEIQTSELDEAVLTLCRRHSTAVVGAALERFAETNGRDMDNPSAYLTFLLGKYAAEGVGGDARASSSKKTERDGPPRKRHVHRQDEMSAKRGDNRAESSVFAQQGIDMQAASGDGSHDLQRIFPSFSRGRGRGMG